MGRREWERGTIVVPAAAWAGFKKQLRDAFNEGVAADFELAKKLLAQVKLANKGKRGVAWDNVLMRELDRYEQRKERGSFGHHYEESVRAYPVNVVSEWALRKSLQASKDVDGVAKIVLISPLKGNPCFKLATSKTLTFNAGNEATIVLDDARRSVDWDVTESKGACDDARASFMGLALFKLLKGIKFTKGSGGTIYGGDEYSEDASRENHGSSSQYDKDYFGPERTTKELLSRYRHL